MREVADGDVRRGEIFELEDELKLKEGDLLRKLPRREGDRVGECRGATREGDDLDLAGKGSVSPGARETDGF